MNKKGKLNKGGYLVEVFGLHGKRFIWELVDDKSLEEDTDQDKIELRGFDLIFFDKDEKGVCIEGFSGFPYLLLLVKIGTWYWKTQFNI